jgi:WD40 repeat protein
MLHKIPRLYALLLGSIVILTLLTGASVLYGRELQPTKYGCFEFEDNTASKGLIDLNTGFSFGLPVSANQVRTPNQSREDRNISPDGRYAAYFANNGATEDFVIKPTLNGSQKPIVRDVYNLYAEQLVSWSPNSERIAFIYSDSADNQHYLGMADVYNMVKKETPLQEFKNRIRSWSADSAYVAISYWSPADILEIFVYSARDLAIVWSASYKITPNFELLDSDSTIQWSHSANWLAYFVEDTDEKSSLYIVSPLNGTEHRFDLPDYTDYLDIRWSPDGRYIAAISNVDIESFRVDVFDIEGQAIGTVSSNIAGESVYYSHPIIEWATEGHSLLYVEADASGNYLGNLNVFDVETRQITTIQNNIHGLPQFTWDRKYLIIDWESANSISTTMINTINQNRLEVASFPKTDQVYSSTLYGWSDVSKWLLLQGIYAKQFYLWAVNVETGIVRDLHGDRPIDLHVASEDLRYLFVSDPSGEETRKIWSVEDGSLKRMPMTEPLLGETGYLFFSPNGSKVGIVYQQPMGVSGLLRIKILRPDGTLLREIDNFPNVYQNFKLTECEIH